MTRILLPFFSEKERIWDHNRVTETGRRCRTVSSQPCRSSLHHAETYVLHQIKSTECKEALRARLEKSEQVSKTPGTAVNQHVHTCFRRKRSLSHFPGLSSGLILLRLWCEPLIWLLCRDSSFWQEFLHLSKHLAKEQVKTHCILPYPLLEAVVVANPSLLGTTTGHLRKFIARTCNHRIQARHRLDGQAHMR